VLLVIAGLATLAITHHAFTAGDWHTRVSLRESGVHSVAWLVLGLTTTALGLSWKQTVLTNGGATFSVLGTLIAVAGSGLLLNPLGHQDNVGSTLIVNWLLLIYLLPAALALTQAGLLHRHPNAISESIKSGPLILGIGCLLLLFAWTSLGVRQGFAGPVLDLGLLGVTAPEWYTYSMAWVGLGAVLLLIGVLSGNATARWGSLVLMMLSVAKVFIFDAAGLRDLYRVLSFLGLGISLIVLGYVYQRFVFRKTAPQPTAND